MEFLKKVVQSQLTMDHISRRVHQLPIMAGLINFARPRDLCVFLSTEARQTWPLMLCVH